MEGLLSIDPGLMIWTLINFGIFFALLMIFGLKPIMNGLKSRENKINSSIEAAEKSRMDSEKLLQESRKTIDSAQREVADIILKGRDQAQQIVNNALTEAESIRQKKIEESTRDIERKKQEAIGELRNEVANLVVMATEKILSREIDKSKHLDLIKSSIDKMPSNKN